MISITTWDTPGDCARSDAERKDGVFGRASNGGRGGREGERQRQGWGGGEGKATDGGRRNAGKGLSVTLLVAGGAKAGGGSENDKTCKADHNQSAL